MSVRVNSLSDRGEHHLDAHTLYIQVAQTQTHARTDTLSHDSRRQLHSVLLKCSRSAVMSQPWATDCSHPDTHITPRVHLALPLLSPPTSPPTSVTTFPKHARAAVRLYPVAITPALCLFCCFAFFFCPHPTALLSCDMYYKKSVVLSCWDTLGIFLQVQVKLMYFLNWNFLFFPKFNMANRQMRTIVTVKNNVALFVSLSGILYSYYDNYY